MIHVRWQCEMLLALLYQPITVFIITTIISIGFINGG